MLLRALNHMTCPAMRYNDFMLMARVLFMGIHYRDYRGRSLFEGDSPDQEIAKVFKFIAAKLGA